MFSKMLVATDLSEASERVICTLGAMKDLGTRQALLIHCMNIRDVGSLADSLMEQARPAFEKQAKMLEDQGFQVKAKMVLGLPQIEINRQADEHDCSLIVVGSHGQTVCEEPTCSPLGHVLFPTDFSDNAEHAFSYVEKIAEFGPERITLLHVQDKSKIDRHLKDRLDEFNRVDTERLERLKAELVKRGAKDVTIDLPYGSPKKEIIDHTKQDDVSLVVLGSQGRGYVAELFLGSVSHAVARHSEVPVLLIPAIR